MPAALASAIGIVSSLGRHAEEPAGLFYGPGAARPICKAKLSSDATLRVPLKPHEHTSPRERLATGNTQLPVHQHQSASSQAPAHSRQQTKSSPKCWQDSSSTSWRFFCGGLSSESTPSGSDRYMNCYCAPPGLLCGSCTVRVPKWGSSVSWHSNPNSPLHTVTESGRFEELEAQ